MSDYRFEDSENVNAAITTESITGSIFQSVDYLDDGTSIADNYIIEVDTYDDPAGYITIKVTAESPNNPYDGITTELILADGITEVEGFGLKGILKPIGEILSNAKEKIIVGKLTNFGIIAGGETSDPIDVYVKNTSGGILLQNKLQIVNKPQFTNIAGTPLVLVKANGLSNSVPALYEITFVGFSGGNQVCQVSADGGIPAEKTIVADGTTENTNVVNGCSIVFEDSGTLNPADTAEIEISDATDFVLIAKDVSGVPDAIWDLGPIDLTQIDGSIVGRINENERARFWIKYEIPDSANSDKNPRQFSTLVTGQVI